MFVCVWVYGGGCVQVCVRVYACGGGSVLACLCYSILVIS